MPDLPGGESADQLAEKVRRGLGPDCRPPRTLDDHTCAVCDGHAAFDALLARLAEAEKSEDELTEWYLKLQNECEEAMQERDRYLRIATELIDLLHNAGMRPLARKYRAALAADEEGSETP